MSSVNAPAPLTLVNCPIVFVDNYDRAAHLIATRDFKEFILVGSTTMANKKDDLKGKNVKVFRIRPEGTWNQFLKCMATIDASREDGKYLNANDVLIISLLAPHDISSALNRHRAVNFISCREMHWLDTLNLPDNSPEVESLHLAMRNMPSYPSPVRYSRLSIQQRFDLTSFEFARFTRPVHCARSVENAQNFQPFYTDHLFGDTYQGLLEEDQDKERLAG